MSKLIVLASLTTAACMTSAPDSSGLTAEATTPPDSVVATDRNPAPFDPTKPYRPDFDPLDMDTHIDAAMLPLRVGAHWRYRSVSADGTEVIDVSVLSGTETIGGTRARIIRDVAHLDGVLIEQTTDWFAQDDDDNVWYLGEFTRALQDDGTFSDEGSWRTAESGAKPGIAMLADPRVGDAYRQEFRKGHAEDFAIVVGFNRSVTVPAGTFHGCMQTRDKSTLDLTLEELKTYCPGVGLVLTEEGDVREELIKFSGL
jgi:hypothetical protein